MRRAHCWLLALALGAGGPLPGAATPARAADAAAIWMAAASMETARAWHTAAPLPEGEVRVVGGTAPGPALCVPRCGFGKVWREHPEVQQLLGYALSPSENGQPFTIQPFLGGLALDAPGLSSADPAAPHAGSATFFLYNTGRFELTDGYSMFCQ